MHEHQQRELAAGLKALADSTRDHGASPEVARAVMSAFASATSVEAAARSAALRRGRALSRFLPLAASLLLAIGAAVWTARTARSVDFVEPAGFVALPEAAVLPQLESATIVRVSLPVAALPAYGVAVADQNAESVEAELLVAQDGQARAIRLVNASTDRSAHND